MQVGSTQGAERIYATTRAIRKSFNASADAWDDLFLETDAPAWPISNTGRRAATLTAFSTEHLDKGFVALMISGPKIVSTFSGCGGMDVGFHNVGFETIWANEIQPDAAQTFRENIGNVVDPRDVREIDPFTDPTIPKGDLVIGGFPCQDFSRIWKQPGLDGSRGNYYKDFRNFVAAQKPKAFVAENVKGLLSANKRRAIDTIVRDLESIEPGYLIKPRLYNFAEYGVPQFRERLLIVGIRKDTGFNFRHPKPTHGPGTENPFMTSGQALRGVEEVPFNNELPRMSQKTREMLELIPEGKNYTSIDEDSEYYVKGLISHVYRRLHRDEPSPTVIAGGGGGTWGYHFEEPRALTNRERARLQSFDDDFVFYGSKTEVRRQIGNAVPPRGVEALATRLLPLFEDNYERVELESEIERLRALPIAERLKEANVEVD